jgi:hypothetical protein
MAMCMRSPSYSQEESSFTPADGKHNVIENTGISGEPLALEIQHLFLKM